MADPSGAQHHGPADLARRVAERARTLGVDRDEVARRAGMAPRYLEHLLSAGSDFDPAGAVRVAAALGLSYEELLHGADAPPPGHPRAAPRPALLTLTETECWDLVGPHGVGRIAVDAEPAPLVFPVNYTVDAHTVVYRTRAGGAAEPANGRPVAFEVDRIDDRLSEGWSVLVTGTAEHVEDEETARHLAAVEGGGPWAGGARPQWIRVRPGAVSGRRVLSGRGPRPASPAPGRPGTGP